MRERTRYLRRVAAGLAASAVAALATGLLGTGVANAAAVEGEVIGAGAPGAIKDRYIVVFKDADARADRVPATAQGLAARYGGAVDRSFGTAVRGFTARMSAAAARRLAADPAVASVEQDRQVRVADTQSGAPWGLDRIDQPTLPLSGTYTYPTTAANVTAYILDSGVRISHSEFGGRARHGYDVIDADADASDCHGHGTHVAGTVAGRTYGVAKQAQIVSVRVLDCQGSGSYSAIIAGVDWVTRNAVKPAVATMSLSGSASAALDTAVRNSIAAGVTYAVAAGNDNIDACAVSPARTAEAITVGATDSADSRASFSNFGSCLDMFAPGVSVLSAAKGDDSATTRMSGTSMAAPHVAGAAALVLAANPTASPLQVRDALVTTATAGAVSNPGTGSPRGLLNIGSVTAPLPSPVPPTTAPCAFTNAYDRSVPDRSTVESKLTVSGCTANASATTKVEVHIKHSDRGDLALYLVAPDGTAYKLKSATSGDDVANVDATYTVNASSEAGNGLWKLRVTDTYTGDTGYLDSWTLTL